jgi:hypothetical protein
MLAVLLAWLYLSLLSCRGQPRGTASLDRGLLAVAAVLLLAGLLAPNKYLNTIDFARRWVPGGFALLLLALPLPRIPPWLLRGVALGALLVMTLTTTFVWRARKRDQLAGLPAALDSLPPRPSVLGLDYVQTSPRLKGRPFIQQFAWAQALHGGKLNFSFAEHASSIVTLRAPRRPPWTQGLAWYATHLRASDLRHFDMVIVNASPARHQQIVRDLPLLAVTTGTPWRLYRVLEKGPEPHATAGGDSGPGRRRN